MIKVLKSITLFSFLLVFTISFSQSVTPADCNKLKNIKLKYVKNSDSTAYIEIDNQKQTEYVLDGKYHIKSDIEWGNNCEYSATITEVTIPNFPYKIGDVMHVKIIKIKDGFVTGFGSVGNKRININFKIID